MSEGVCGGLNGGTHVDETKHEDAEEHEQDEGVDLVGDVWAKVGKHKVPEPV